MKATRATLKKLYRDAILQVFGSGDEELDSELIRAVKKDIHLSDKAPGGWVPHSLLEIYCEGGIPNATDVNSFPPMPEFGYKGGTFYNSEKWQQVDDIVNLMWSVLKPGTYVWHEPYNGAVINIYGNKEY